MMESGLVSGHSSFVPESKTHTNAGVPITKIHVTRIPPNVKRSDFIECFGRFGKIVDCFIKWSPDVAGTALFAFITYESIFEALQARKNRIKMHGVQLKVAAADSWHQETPKRSIIPTIISFYTFIIIYIISGSSNFNSRNAKNAKIRRRVNLQDENNILNVLNEYCFMKIFSYLPLQQLIKSERVCKRWNFLVHEKYKSMLEFKTNTLIYTNVLHSLLKKFGCYLKTLHIDTEMSMFDYRTPYIIAKLCPNLQELYVFKLESENWNDVIHKCKHLKSLSFHSCKGIKDYTFRNSKLKLEELVINDTENPVGNFLTNLNTNCLKKLTIINTPIKVNQLVKSVAYLRNLKHLHLESIPVATDGFISNILILLPQLESLKLNLLNLRSGLEPIANMKDLKTLAVKSNTAVDDEFISMICANCTQLIDLDISDQFQFNKELTEKGISHIWSLKNLEILNLSGLNVCESIMELGKHGRESKLKKLLFRCNNSLSQEAICNVFMSCPKIEFVDLYENHYINSSIINKISSIIHTNASQNECIPNRITLKVTRMFIDYVIEECRCINLEFEENGEEWIFSDFGDEFDDTDDISEEDFFNYNDYDNSSDS